MKNIFFRCFPQLYWMRIASHAKRLGIDRLYLILSFDSDTSEDIPASEKIFRWLRSHDIKATFAVPGVQLREGRKVYQRLADEGAEFINHGALPHTEWREGRYWSITFYRDLPEKEVVNDIREGHKIVRDVTGKTPLGFRAPHFGLFERSRELKLIHRTAKDLGYRFTTTTTPAYSLKHGPLWRSDGVWEIPLSGSYKYPLSVFDSWSNVISPYQPVIKNEYHDMFLQTLNWFTKMGLPGILNYFVDPAHVGNSDLFYKCMNVIVDRKIPSIHYSEVLDLVEGR